MTTINKTIVDLFDLDKMSPDKAVEMVNRLGKMVFQATLVRVLPMLSDAEMTEYEKIISSNQGGEVIFKFLGEKIPDFENIIKEESEALRAELAGDFASAGV